MHESIGSYVMDEIENGTINPEQEAELRSIMDAVFRPASMDRRLRTALNMFGYVPVLAQIPALITQEGEFMLALLENPVFAVENKLKAYLGKSKITVDDIGLEPIGQEWVDSRLQNFSKTIMKPFEFVNRVNFETYLNTVIDKYRVKANRDDKTLKDELGKYFFENEISDVIKDLKTGELTNDMRFLAFCVLSGKQPVSILEMTEGYAKAGNYRTFYMFKTFTLKRLDMFRVEAGQVILQGIQQKNPYKVMRGIARMLWLYLMLLMADTSLDVAKDFIRGKQIDMGGHLADNSLNYLLLSRYAASKLSSGIGGIVKEFFNVPASSIDNAIKDLYNLGDDEKGFKSIRSIPYAGEMLYWWVGEGADKNKKEREKMADDRL
jgi:hypothetical protein